MPFSFAVSSEVVATSSNIEPIKDTESPENFIPVISNDPNVFDGKFFLVFATQDKGSGIDRYEVREGESGSFFSAQSPYRIKDQSLGVKIFVKAIDKNGNEKIAEVPAQKMALWKQNSLVFGILLVLALLVFLYRKKLWKKNI